MSFLSILFFLLRVLVVIVVVAFFLFPHELGFPEGVILYPSLLCPWTGYFGAASRLAFPLFYIMFHWRFFRCPFCFRRPRARNLVRIFARTNSLQILFSGAIGKGKSLPLQAQTPRPTWFPRESLMPLLKILFSEIPVVLWLGN